ncbi:SIS domain-containing protein [Nitrosopumilus ureiphilus]|uniref:Probable phosphoheptose isomerase n=1 Tax=Nitrosopumilus ureiphilus TaxID=1470067 RepID=A0A7D5R9P4_9ARCH|nr:SIS domain-containing protein [Nitrosopumilus ureiphilus]QLH05804.1 phosphoheptose isomerase [Nitrosopumilus ureiphilus]
MQVDIEESIKSSSEIIRNATKLATKIQSAIEIIISTIEQGHKIVLFGNGGSAADAQHIAAELIGRFKIERRSLPAISLTTDSSILTSLSNDYSFDMIFERQCEGLVLKDDVVIGISTSGNSKNVERGISASKKRGAKTIALLGNNGGIIKNVVDLDITVDSENTSQIQEVHRVIYHIICEHVEKYFEKND